MSHRNGRGITYRQCVGAVVLWAVTAGACNLLGGCGTVEGLGRDLATSSRMVRDWWGKGDAEPLLLEASIGEVPDAE